MSRSTSSNVGRRHRAHAADVLRHHQVGAQLADDRGVDLVQRRSVTRGKRDRVLDLLAGLGCEIKCRARHHWQRGGLRRVVALVRHRDELLAQPEREQRLRRAWQQRDDAQAAYLARMRIRPERCGT